MAFTNVLEVVILFSSAAVLAAIGKIAYNLFFHPLRKFPGPLIARATPFYRHYKFVRGDLVFACKELHDKYGPVVRIRPDELSFIRPQAWKDIYLPQAGPNGQVTDMARYDRFYQFSGENTPDTIVSLDRSYHASLRKTLSPAFSERSLRQQEPILQEYVNLLIQKLVEESKNGEVPVNLRDWLNFLSFDVIGNLAFGSDFNGLKNSKYHPWVRAITRNIREFSVLQVLMYLGLKMAVHVLADSSLLKGKVLHENLTRKMVLERLKQEKERPDFLDPLINKKDPLSFEELLANGTQLLIAGSESTSTLLTSTIALLVDRPETMKKLTEEIRSTFQNEDEINLASVGNLTYLNACLWESLRCFPPVPPSLPRVAPPFGAVVDGFDIPGKSVCSLASWAAYHSSEYFTDPFTFHPERFLKDERFANDNFEAFQPFGLGVANCPGRNLAFAETRLTLTKVFYNFDITGVPKSKDWIHRQKAFLLWDKENYWAYVKPVRA